MIKFLLKIVITDIGINTMFDNVKLNMIKLNDLIGHTIYLKHNKSYLDKYYVKGTLVKIAQLNNYYYFYIKYVQHIDIKTNVIIDNYNSGEYCIDYYYIYKYD